MYDFDIEINRKDKIIIIIYCIVLFAFVFGAGYMLGLRNAGTDVSDYRDGAGNIGEQLSIIESNQRKITDGIKGAEGAAARIEGGIQQAAASAERTEAAVADAGIILDQCQQIIGRVRNRGQTGKVAN